MSTAELTIRLAAMILGSLLVALGMLVAFHDRYDEGCLPYVVALLGFLMICAGFPGAEIFQ